MTWTMPKKRTVAFPVLIPILLLSVLVPVLAPAAGEDESRPEDIISFLNQTIVWHRQLTSQQQLVSEPSDAIFLHDSHEIADQVVRLSFDFARIEARMMVSQGKAGGAETAAAPSQYQNLIDLTARANVQVKQLQAEIEGMKPRLSTATGRNRRLLESTIAETQSELDLQTARRDSVQSILEFASGTAANSSGGTGLLAQIEELARSSHAAATSESKQTSAKNGEAQIETTPVAIATAGDRKSDSTGLLTLATDLLELRRKLHLLDASLAMTDALLKTSRGLRSPMITKIRGMARRGDEIAAQPDSQDPDVLAQQRKELDAMTASFRHLTSVSLPLSKQGILLDQYKRNLTNWRNVVQNQYSARSRSLLLRVAMLALALGLIFGTAELWRRATFRYVQDPRRRHQFMIVRRIIVWPLTAVIIVMAFASGLGGITTFAGLLTAGIAVSLQNVILSAVGYFFLIGKYGVRVGDRIQISGVTGDVIDIGMIRMHLMEVSSGAGAKPTGRVVAFSNAVVFQPDAAIFRQIPGTSFVWHEVSLTLGPGTDYQAIEKRMLESVNTIFADYRDKMDLQHNSMQRAIAGQPAGNLTPESRLRLVSEGIQVIVRYPVEIENAAAIDDRVTREVLNATGQQPKLSLEVPTSEATPAVSPATKK
jgi:small-conductance mechanosensitive channel